MQVRERCILGRFRIKLAEPIIDREMRRAVLDVLSGERMVLGESVFKFEEEFARFCGCDFAIGVASGTAAIQLALMTAGLARGFRCLTSAASFIATANCIILAQGKPLFVDISLGDYCIDPYKVNHITKKSSAILPVHLYGHPADMRSICETARRRNLVVIEDACQAHGASIDGRKVGSWGDFGCFSFYPSKNMTVGGDGGIITTNNKRAAEKIRRFRDAGRRSKYVHDIIGYSFRLNTVNAAIGRVQLKKLNVWNEIRRKIAYHYHKRLASVPQVIHPPLGTATVRPSHHLYVIRTSSRDKLKHWLERSGIECGVHYPLPIHLQPAYRSHPQNSRGQLVNTESLCRSCLSLPIHPSLTGDDVDYVVNRIQDFFRARGDRA
jgi:perosamine synthetase